MMKHKQLIDQGELHSSHCEADNVGTALRAHSSNFHVLEENSTP